MAEYRWAVSGTPIQNSLVELFPYFKFLHIPHTGSISVFRSNYCLPNSEVCSKRLNSRLHCMMIRRTHADQVLGAPLVKLPKNTQQTLRLTFNAVEKEIYDRVRQRCAKYVNS